MSFLIYMKQALSNLFKPPVTTSYPLKPKTFKPHDRGRVINDISRCPKALCPNTLLNFARQNYTEALGAADCR